MNKLPKLYLCGAMANTSDADCVDWREYVKKRWADLGGDCSDPVARADYRDHGDFDFKTAQSIVEGDKDAIDVCGVLFWNYQKPSVGSSMECLYAYENDKEVIVVNNFKGILSPWIIYHSDEIFKDIDTAIEHLYKEYTLDDEEFAHA